MKKLWEKFTTRNYHKMKWQLMKDEMVYGQCVIQQLDPNWITVLVQEIKGINPYEKRVDPMRLEVAVNGKIVVTN